MLNREGSLCNKESLPSPVQLFVANLIRSQGLPELTLSVLSLDSGFRICSFALTRGRRDGRRRNTAKEDFQYDMPFLALFVHVDSFFPFLHALWYTTYEDFPFDMPFLALFEHDNIKFSFLHVFTAHVISSFL